MIGCRHSTKKLKCMKYCFVGIVATVFLLYAIYSAILPPDPRLMRWPQPRSHYRMLLNVSTTRSSPTTTPTSTNSTPSNVVSNCTAWKPLVFIKTHKTGSTTLQTIVNRFGFFHNLSFVFNRKSSVNGHFYFLPLTAKSPHTSFLPPLKVRVGDYNKYTNYDMLAVHVRYNRTAMDRFMKEGAKYITIIREPSAQWESAFDHFIFHEAFENVSQVPKEKWLQTFLEKPAYYREKLRFLPYENVMGRRWYYAQNSQMYDLGLDAGSSFYNETIINATVKRLEQEFSLILITEYFDESLLVLKKELCWDYEDIVYFSKNLRESRRNLTAEVRQKIRTWNHADVLLYHHFNRTLWRKIKAYGPKFEKDLDYFRELNQHVFEKCGNTKATISRAGKRVYKHMEFTPKKNATLFCRTVAENKRVLFHRVYDRQNPNKKVKKPNTSGIAAKPETNTSQSSKPNLQTPKTVGGQTTQSQEMKERTHTSEAGVQNTHTNT